MGWVKLDDGFFNNKKIVTVSKDAKMLYLAGLCYSGSSLTDGVIPANAVTILAAQTGIKSPGRAVQELVNAGLWVSSGDGYEVHDYLEHNSSAEFVRAKRDAAKDRMQRSRSPNVRANNSRSSPNVREPEVEVETDIETLSHESGAAQAPERNPPESLEPIRSLPRQRATQLPGDFTVTDSMREFAQKHGFTPPMIEFETEKFVNYWQGEGRTKKDWAATWRTWLLSSRDRPGTRSAPLAELPRNARTHTEDETIDWVGNYGRKASNA